MTGEIQDRMDEFEERLANKEKRDADLKEYLDKMFETAKDLMTPKQIPPYEPMIAEPIRFKHWTEICPLEDLANQIMQVLNGHTLEEIVNASKIVEIYVASQSKGQLFAYQPTRAW